MNQRMSTAKVRRNFCYDVVKMQRDMWTAIDEFTRDNEEVDRVELIQYIMRKTRGAINPMMIEEAINKFNYN